ncbi:MAG: thrombospondin type 3 repeat-containing protein, partial [Thermomicrobium sp.]|nr:thrombospondin type 3 repeat-containing protein [Thermomicrobium sp.]
FRLEVPSDAAVRAVELQLIAPGGDRVFAERYAVSPGEPLEVEVDLSGLGSAATLPGTWRAEWVDADQPDRILAAVSFRVQPAATIAWQTSAPRQPVPAGDCRSHRPIVELGIRAQNSEPADQLTVYAVVSTPNGQEVTLRPIATTGDDWGTIRVSLCSIVPRDRQAGTWTVRWYRSDTPGQPVATDRFQVELPPTPTSTPAPVIEWVVPTEPVQPQDCGATVDLRVRNAAGTPDRTLAVVIQVIPPGRQPVDLASVELRNADWATVSLTYCQAAGGSDIAGTWTVRAVDAATRQTVLGQATFEVRPIPAPPPPQSQPAPQPPPPPPAPPPPAVRDTDGDDLPDDEELSFGTDPYNSDTDSDGLSDGSEVYVHGTDPRKEDTDLDGTSDFDEILIGSDPWDPCSPWQFAYACQYEG